MLARSLLSLFCESKAIGNNFRKRGIVFLILCKGLHYLFDLDFTNFCFNNAIFYVSIGF